MNSITMLILNNRLPLLVFVLVIFVTGICFGAFAVKTVGYEINQSLFQFFNSFIKDYNKIEYDKSSLVSNSVKFNLLNIIIFWLLGCTVFLVFLIPILLFFKGFVLGFTVGFLISQYDMQGLLISVVSVFPQNIFIIPSFILAGAVGISFSLDIIKNYRGRINLNFEDFLDYSLRMGIFTIFLLTGSIIETYITPYLFSLVIG